MRITFTQDTFVNLEFKKMICRVRPAHQFLHEDARGAPYVV